MNADLKVTELSSFVKLNIGGMLNYFSVVQKLSIN